MRCVVTLLWLLLLAATRTFAACPVGSSCVQYNGTNPRSTMGGTAMRAPEARANDQGINILEFGADPTGVSDSTAAIQAAIDYAFTHNNAGATVTAGQGVNNVFCPAGIYKTSYPSSSICLATCAAAILRTMLGRPMPRTLR